ncbi:MAG: diaminobutyrate--2-oxoglutarate transaminase [Gammaproteobacteria bacterium]
MMLDPVFERFESQVQSYARAFPSTFERACGAELWDIQGRRYLDFLSGAGSLNYGHNNPVLKEALIEYIRRDGVTHSLDLHTPAKKRFLEAMRDIVLEPRNLDYVVQFTGPTGTNAVEAALKIARKVTGRSNVICFTNAFHGVSLGALAATGNQHHRGASGISLQGTTVMPYDGYLGDGVDTIAYLDRMLSDPSSGIDSPAAVIVETIQGEGGINTASIDWMKSLEALCRDKGILLIVDDIQAGCGRTGTFFSFESAGLLPDIVTLSKSLSGYGLPFAVVLLQRSLDVWKPGEHNGTFRGNNHAFATAAVALEHYWSTGTFEVEVHEKGQHLGARLQELVDQYSPHLLEVRGRGMMRGLYCADPNRAAAVTSAAFEQGLILERSGPADEVIKFLMPLTIRRAEMDEGLDVLAHALREEFNDREVGSLVPAGLLKPHSPEPAAKAAAGVRGL